MAAGVGASATAGLRPARAYWLGRVGYLEASALQQALVERRQRGEIPDTFLFLEHPPVVTLGRAAHDDENLLAPPSVLAARGVEVYETTRGGDVTFHGPGQLVGYGIVDLKDHGRDVALYLRKLEEALIGLLAGHGLEGVRDPAFTGVWLGGGKICAMGVRVDRWVTSHGFALNVDVDLSYFDLIVPCGIRGHGVTSLARATGRAHDVAAVAREAGAALARVFAWRMEDGDATALDRPQPTGERILGGVRRVRFEP
ncbi:MAG: lipoyl(octanoyl) transferase LipB [Candidatus Eisenbacteria bacterium]